LERRDDPAFPRFITNSPLCFQIMQREFRSTPLPPQLEQSIKLVVPTRVGPPEDEDFETDTGKQDWLLLAFDPEVFAVHASDGDSIVLACFLASAAFLSSKARFLFCSIRVFCS
jgi:hypothetical protein